MNQKHNRQNRRLLLFIAPSFIGVMVFFIVPFILSIRYIFVDNVRSMKVVGLRNWIEILTNDLFLTALKNTLLFILLCVPLNLLVSFLLAVGLKKVSKGRNLFSLIFLLPLVIPSGSIIYLWDCLFRTEGVVNRFLFLVGISAVNWAESKWILPIIVFLFLWKNAGYNMLLFWSGLNLIPKSYYEFARLEGANSFQLFYHVTAVFLAPTSFIVLLMTFINSFKSFREIYLLFGALPNQRIYMLQHYMTSQFQGLNLPKLSVASYILTFAITIFIGVLFYAQKRLSENFS